MELVVVLLQGTLMVEQIALLLHSALLPVSPAKLQLHDAFLVFLDIISAQTHVSLAGLL
jgi:hypothetical protein